MSGFVGLVAEDGAPVDRELLERLTQSLAFRGPDGRDVWAGGRAGLGHTLLRTTDDSGDDRQPATLDGRVFVSADARVDRREDLAREIGLTREALHSPDCQLILSAYSRWGERCVEHLFGDFAFAIWDDREQKLFCARDHFGVKPFYYARRANALVVSNTLNCVRRHPGVSDRLDELAVADYLLFEFKQDQAATTFADIQRLPPAHALTWTPAGMSIRRYWSLPGGEELRYRRASEYEEHFGAVFEQAVRDRVRSRRLSVYFSGGLDSTTAAAAVRRVCPSVELRAFTVVHRWLIADEEEHYAGLAARHLEIPIEFVPADEAGLYDQPELYRTPEPTNTPLKSITDRLMKAAAAHSAVAIGGQGGDPLFCLTEVMRRPQIRAIRPAQAAAVLASYMWDQRRIPRFRLRGTVCALARPRRDIVPPFPSWLDGEFVARNGLEQRWAAHHRHPPIANRRPDAARAVTGPFWPCYFESSDPASWPTPVEEWHPFFSVPLVCYMMSIAEVPFCVDKYLLRRYATGLLPEEVRRRPKSPLRADPVAARVSRSGRFGAHAFSVASPRLQGFVDAGGLKAQMTATGDGFHLGLRVISFDLWLRTCLDGG